MMPFVAIDTETTLIQERETCRTASGREVAVSPWKVPELVCLSYHFADGTNKVLARAEIEQFIKGVLDGGLDIVFHNAAFDFWVIDAVLSPESGLRRKWREAVHRMVFHDTMILDILYRLSCGVFDTPVLPRFELVRMENRSLERLASEYADIILNKDESVRLNYGQFLGRPVQDMPASFQIYAAHDAMATACVWERLNDLVRDVKLLSEPLQTAAAIALARLDQTGVNVDVAEARRLRDLFVQDMPALEQELVDEGLADWVPDPRRPKTAVKRPAGQTEVSRNWTTVGDELIKTAVYKNGTVREIRAYPIIRMNLARIRERLQGLVVPHLTEPPPLTETGLLQLDADWWSKHLPLTHSQGLQTWHKRQKLQKILTTYLNLYTQTPQVFARWHVLGARSGRMSCSSPNIQNIPKRKHGIRSLFVPSPGKVFVKADYSQQELFTLTECMCQMGIEGPMLKAIENGVDLHTSTARFIAGRDEITKGERQAAKALNFGVPGGLGARKLRDYAEAEYGVKWTEAEAKQVRFEYLRHYPDVAQFLRLLQTGLDANLRRVSGRGVAFWEKELFGTHRALSFMDLRKAMHRHPNIAIRKLISQAERSLTVRLPSGRVRAGCMFTEGANTYFQGSASDVTKLAMVKCFDANLTVVLVVHDEIVVECFRQDEDRVAEVLSTCMIQAFKELCPRVGQYSKLEVEYPLLRWGAAKDKDGQTV